MSNTILDTATVATPDADTTVPEKPVKPKRVFKNGRSFQSRLVTKRIVRAREVITNIQNNDELAAKFAEKGFDAERLTQGLALQAAADAAYNVRPQAMSTQQAATGELERAAQAVRRAFFDFRLVGRGHFKNASARKALGLDNPRPHDLEIIMAQARASFTAALDMPEYRAELAAYKYTPARLQAMLAEVDTLYALVAQAQETRSAAQRATQTRDAAVQAMDDWMRNLYVAARLVTRGRPDLKASVGLS